MSHDDHDSRLTKLESTVNNLASSVTALTESIAEDRKAMWEGIESSRTKITWPIIVTTCAFLLALGGALGGLTDMISRLRAEKLEVMMEWTRKDLERHERQMERFASVLKTEH